MNKNKTYGVTQLAEKLGVHRQTVNYWIKKGWLIPRRDYRNYPVFTKNDLKHIEKWHITIKGTTVFDNK